MLSAPNAVMITHTSIAQIRTSSVVNAEYERRFGAKKMNQSSNMNNQVLVDLEIERLSCLLTANEFRKNDGFHMGGKNVREIIEMMEQKAAVIGRQIEEMLGRA